jgi:3-methyladenine DNA glycosylase AlkD
VTASDVSKALRQSATPEKAKTFTWFFKTGPGQYGEGDKFLGVTVPQQRKIAKKFRDLPLKDVEKLIASPWHEERLTGLFILVLQFKKADEAEQKIIYDFYLTQSGPVGLEIISGPRKMPAKRIFWGINNWDLVDSSAGYIVGPWLDGRPEKMKVLEKLAKSDHLWERRIAMIATSAYINNGRADEALRIAEILVDDKHDLIQKSVGWMLREIGKKVDRKILVSFLDKHAAMMPRTALRYAIEHFDAPSRTKYLQAKNTRFAQKH